jgi:23S rRNA (uracil1939-C5)-methyltransferase
MTKHRLEIDELGAKGDGIANDGTFVPFTLPGDLVEIDDEVENHQTLPPSSIVRASPFRIDPVCRHFGVCGGCSLQHIDKDKYLQWKRQLVADAFSSAGIETEIDPCVPISVGSRRRATFSAITTAAGTIFGFLGRQSHEIIDIAECPILVAKITSQFEALRALARLSVPASEQIKLSVLACENGLDIALEATTVLSERRRKAIIDWAVSGHKVRVSYDSEIIIQTIVPQLSIAGATLTPPPGSFVQAVGEAEKQMADLVCGHLKKSKRVVDLFSGVGTFALHLLPKSIVHAVEYEKAALTSLENSQKSLTGTKVLTVESRDLDRRPLQARELETYNGAIFDPPRAGAEAQVRELAKSKITKIAAVSCNPATLVRDTKILIDAGYKLIKVTPIDQFLFSSHVEVVALFERKNARAKRPVFG